MMGEGAINAMRLQPEAGSFTIPREVVDRGNLEDLREAFYTIEDEADLLGVELRVEPAPGGGIVYPLLGSKRDGTITVRWRRKRSSAVFFGPRSAK